MFKYLRHPFARPNFYLCSFLMCIPILVWVFAYAHNPDPGVKPWLDGFTGNLIAGIIQAVMFLFLALYLDGKTEQKIDTIDKVTKESKSIIDRNELITKEKELVYEFEKFLHQLPYYDVRFPDIAPRAGHLGLEYTIEAVRDPASRVPRKYETEWETLWVVKVRGPAQIEVRTPEDLLEYSNSPIKENTYYFCRFFNGSWHMGEDAPLLRHRFYMSGYVGPTQYGISANHFMADFSNPIADMTQFAEFTLDLEGRRPTRATVSVNLYKLFRGTTGGLYLTINDSLPRKIYVTNPPETYTDTGWFFVIEKMIGFASGDYLGRIENEVQGELARLNIEIPKIPWHQTEAHRYEPPV